MDDKTFQLLRDDIKRVEKGQILIHERIDKVVVTLNGRLQSLEKFKWGFVGAGALLSIAVTVLSIWSFVRP